MRRLFRLAGRSLWLLAVLAIASVDAFAVAAGRGFKPSLQTRTLWLHRNSKRVLQVFASGVETRGPLPKSGLLVCNHLSYLDILLAYLTIYRINLRYQIRPLLLNVLSPIELSRTAS